VTKHTNRPSISMYKSDQSRHRWP